MQLEIKFKSIAVRWFFNIFLIVALVVCTVIIALSALVGSLYTERITTLADDLTYEFNYLSASTGMSFKDTAIELAENFSYKTKLEVQVIDKDGNIIVTTTGFRPTEQKMPDYEKAKSSGGSAVIKTKTAESESVLCSTTSLYDSSGRYLGAYRWITSLKNTNKVITWIVISLVLAGLLILAFCAFSGLFFIRSIVKPIRDVSNIARKIAMGDFNSRIEIKKNDEIGELCDTINYMASELNQAENLKNDFISSVSHELRTPLTAIRGWSETAKMSLGTDEELVKRGLDVVLSEADRLSSLVEELLDFSRMETGRLLVVAQPLDVSQILSESVDMYIELARQQGIELIYTRSAEDLTVSGDPNRLKQVFINIIDNAVKYTEKGGQVLVDQTAEEGCVRITVKDTGVGIPAQDIDRVKEKFYKANKTVRGSGIGLAVADEIIKQHKGLLFIESDEGVGTTVTIVLPLYEPIEETEVTAVEQSEDKEN
ncbi:MAG: HAMP domain-containing sensor histidine kinase [Acutalibacteraceae bacterium]|nr:HAMP domain-containing sensor histidine kinase [Acutalibacteraceae bacterium]